MIDYFKIISYYYNNPFIKHFKIKKTRELLAKKNFWSSFCWDVKAYVKGRNICWILKLVYYKSYKDFESLSVSTNN